MGKILRKAMAVVRSLSSLRISNDTDLQAVYASAHACEIVGESEREEAWRQLMQRHSNLAGSQLPNASEAVFMRARCQHVSMLDFTQGLGHREQFEVGLGEPATGEHSIDSDHWGVSVSAQPAS